MTTWTKTVSLIKCVSVSGRVLTPWVIYKAKLPQKAWKNKLKSGYIALLENVRLMISLALSD
jgi:hypothetical protein